MATEPVTLAAPDGTRYTTDDPAEIVTLTNSYGYTTVAAEPAKTTRTRRNRASTTESSTSDESSTAEADSTE